MPQFLAPVQFAVVTTLPSAASAPNAVLVQGGKLWFSNGTSWVDLGAIGGDGIDYVQGTVRITVGTTAPSSPAVGDIWIDTN